MGDVAIRPSDVCVGAGLSDVNSKGVTTYPYIVEERAYELSEYQMKVASSTDRVAVIDGTPRFSGLVTSV